MTKAETSNFEAMQTLSPYQCKSNLPRGLVIIPSYVYRAMVSEVFYPDSSVYLTMLFAFFCVPSSCTSSVLPRFTASPARLHATYTRPVTPAAMKQPGRSGPHQGSLVVGVEDGPGNQRRAVGSRAFSSSGTCQERTTETARLDLGGM